MNTIPRVHHGLQDMSSHAPGSCVTKLQYGEDLLLPALVKPFGQAVAATSAA